MPAGLSIEAISKAYGDVQALDAVSFQVRSGECVALLGPNGAGKSTLLSILATLQAPDAGQARVAGHSVREDPGRVRRALGVLFQESLTSKHLTAREVLLHHARLYALPKQQARDRADELLELVDLTSRAEDRVSTFSGGMKRRLDLARVLMTRPQVLLLDEPTTGLDLRGRTEVQARIRDLVEQGTTVLLATHDLDEAQRLAQRVAVLDRGQLLALDTPSALARKMGHRVVRVELGPQPTSEAAARVRGVLDGMGTTLPTGEGVELLLEQGAGVSAGEVVDALDAAEVGYEQVTVREPNLGDVFLELTGRRLEAVPEPEEVAA